MKIYKIAKDDSEKIKDLQDDINDLEKDYKNKIKDLEKKIKDMEKVIDQLNIGNRQMYQTKSIFTSLQRKVEKMDSLLIEWNKYKEQMDSKLSKLLEEGGKARVKT